MGTSAAIIVPNERGGFDLISVHFDGYPDGVGKGLLRHAPDYPAARKLLEKGDLSSIDADKDAPEHYVDRGEKLSDNAPTHHATALSALKEARDFNYQYLLTTDGWRCGNFLVKDLVGG